MVWWLGAWRSMGSTFCCLVVTANCTFYAATRNRSYWYEKNFMSVLTQDFLEIWRRQPVRAEKTFLVWERTKANDIHVDYDAPMFSWSTLSTETDSSRISTPADLSYFKKLVIFMTGTGFNVKLENTSNPMSEWQWATGNVKFNLYPVKHHIRPIFTTFYSTWFSYVSLPT